MGHVTAGWVCACALALLCGPPTAAASDFHDFDFAIGGWGTRILHLQHSPGKADSWAVWTGTVVAAKVWGGRANIQEIAVDTPSGRVDELRLCLYRPQSRQWYLHWADSDDGVMAKPMIGQFAGGTGRFYDQEDQKGRAIFVRDLYSHITPRSYHWQQAFSSDGGTTWQPNWNVTLALDSSRATVPRQMQQPSAGSDTQAHAFDFVWGDWLTNISFLPDPFAGSSHWLKIHGRVTTRKLWGGRADLAQTEAKGPHGPLEDLTLRLYDPQARQWYLYLANGADGVLDEPLIGDFKDGRGVFYNQDTYGGRTVLVRHVYYDIAADSYRFAQALSDDGGKTWRTNFTARLTRVGN
jgi:hypothetical protein